MTKTDPIDAQLLDEMRIGPRSPADLQRALSHDDVHVSLEEVMRRLTRLCQEGLVHGPGISRLHYLGVDLTSLGRRRLKELQVCGTRFGSWILMG